MSRPWLHRCPGYQRYLFVLELSVAFFEQIAVFLNSSRHEAKTQLSSPDCHWLRSATGCLPFLNEPLASHVRSRGRSPPAAALAPFEPSPLLPAASLEVNLRNQQPKNRYPLSRRSLYLWTEAVLECQRCQRLCLRHFVGQNGRAPALAVPGRLVSGEQERSEME